MLLLLVGADGEQFNDVVDDVLGGEEFAELTKLGKEKVLDGEIAADHLFVVVVDEVDEESSQPLLFALVAEEQINLSLFDDVLWRFFDDRVLKDATLE